MTANSEKNLSNDDFSKLVDSSFKDNKKYEKIIIAGNVVSITKDNILIDVGLKSEGKIPMSEFSRVGRKLKLK